ncbi:MAG: serine protease [Alphaproteobacteria bacterium]|nr:serine protease [Alphaproteobacteria bacterium]
MSRGLGWIGNAAAALALALLVVACSDQEPDLDSLLAGVVRIVGVDAAGEQSVLGTGFVLNDRGDVVTVRKGVADAASIKVLPSGSKGSRGVPAEILWSSEEHDLAILRVSGLKQPPLTIAEVVPEGGANLFLLGFSGDGGLQAALKPGAMGRMIKLPRRDGRAPIEVIMHSATVETGSEGAPLLDSCGAVIGIANRELDPSGTPPQGIYFGATMAPLAAALRAQKIPFNAVTAPCRDL